MLAVGRLVPIKRFDLTLRVIGALRRSAPSDDWLLLLVGSGPQREALENLAKQIGVESAVRFEGYQSGEELVIRHQAADLQLCTSEFENWSLSLVEGLACGHPVVAFDTGGTPELLAPLDPALIVAESGPEAMANRVLELMSAPERMPELNARARSIAEQYSWEHVVDRLERVLTEVAHLY
jgi:glycosyltransferase involved in cell wall biosynthesis